MRQFLDIKKMVIICLVISGASTILYGQTAQETMVAVNKTMNSAGSYEMNVDVFVYRKTTDTAPYFKYTGKTARQGNNYYINMMEKVTLMNSECALMIDKRQKLIVYKSIDKKTANSRPEALMQLNIDSVIRSNSKALTLLSTTPGQQVIFLSTPGEAIRSITITVDTKLHVMKEIDYVYMDYADNNTTSKAVIRYTQIRLNEPVNSSLFDDKKFISVKGSKIIPAEAYKKFKVINQNENTF